MVIVWLKNGSQISFPEATYVDDFSRKGEGICTVEQQIDPKDPAWIPKTTRLATFYREQIIGWTSKPESVGQTMCLSPGASEISSSARDVK
jgi:hypothetical protein